MRSAAWGVNVPDELTIGEFLIGILPRLSSDKSLPWWPPDCFGLCLALLKRTGAYAVVSRDWPPEPRQDDALRAWRDKVGELGAAWRKGIGGLETQWSFDGLASEWKTVCQSFDLPLGETRRQRALCDALIKIVAVADEASEGVSAPQPEAGEYDPVLYIASDTLRGWGTLCLDIDGSRRLVLPRKHTPQSGLTERSLSLYLSLCEASEVTPQWQPSPFLQTDSLNLLLIPWPFEVVVNQFQETTDTAGRLPKDFGFFTFTTDSPEDLTERV